MSNFYFNSEALAQYIRQLEAYPPFEEGADRTASREELILHSLRYVITIAKTYAYSTEQLFDYIQEGNVGLIMAADTYDSEKGSFLSWATYYIKDRIRKAQIMSHRVVKLPRDAYRYHYQIKSMMKTMTREEVAKELGIKPMIIDIVMEYHTEELHETIPAEETSTDLDVHMVKKAVRKVATPKQQKVLEMRLNDYTHEEIAGILGVSYQRVQQLEKACIKALTGGAA